MDDRDGGTEVSGLIGWLRRSATRTSAECAGCGAPMARTDEACPQACGFDRRGQRWMSRGSWARLDRL